MKRVRTVLAVIGVFLVVGGVGKMDYMVEIGVDYPLSATIITCGIGLALIIPKYLEVLNGQK